MHLSALLDTQDFQAGYAELLTDCFPWSWARSRDRRDRVRVPVFGWVEACLVCCLWQVRPVIRCTAGTWEREAFKLQRKEQRGGEYLTIIVVLKSILRCERMPILSVKNPVLLHNPFTKPLRPNRRLNFLQGGCPVLPRPAPARQPAMCEVVAPVSHSWEADGTQLPGKVSQGIT